MALHVISSCLLYGSEWAMMQESKMWYISSGLMCKKEEKLN